MDELQKIAIKYKELLHKQYYFELARKQQVVRFDLTFEKSDFNHMAGLHKLTDIASIQNVYKKDRVFDNIIKGNISHELIKHSRFYHQIHDRLTFLENLEELLDGNQIVFKYIEKMNMVSRIEADYLLENAHKTDIIYIFLSERSKEDKTQVPIMCCRSFFPMNELDYSKNQPSYTLLKKVKIDTVTGERVIQYDRSKIIEQAKTARTEPERRSIMQQLNEKKAQLAIKEILDERKNISKNKHDHERY